MSWQARLVNASVRMAGRAFPRVTALASRLLGAGLNRVARRVADVPVMEVSPRRRRTSARLIYLHGGSYTLEIRFWHWRLVRYLARAIPAHVDVPIYALAPHATAASTVAAITELVDQRIAKYGEVTLIGDSAGGGMALAVAQQLRDRGRAQPARIILVSPWLDVTITDPRQLHEAPPDLLQRIDQLRAAGQLYAGSLDVGDPRVSPLRGSMNGLAPIHVFSGTRDLLNADAQRLAEACKQVGQPLSLHEAHGMPHDYPLYPLLPAARDARKKIARIARSG